MLRHMVEVGASDLHLKAGNVPFVRIDGELDPTAFPAMSSADTEAAAIALMPEHKRREFESTSEADFGQQRGGTSVTLAAWHAGRRQRVTDIAAGAAPEHRRSLKHNGAVFGIGEFAATPRNEAAAWPHETHGGAQECRLACAVGADQHRRHSG